MYTVKDIKDLMALGFSTNEIVEMAKGTSPKEKTSVSTSKKSKGDKAPTSKKSNASSPKEKKTREERLTEEFGDKATRTKFVELRNKVAAEFLAIGKEEGVYIPRRSYKKVLKSTTESLNGKMNKKVVRKAFLEAAK